MKKIVYFVPKEYAEKTKQSLFNAGAGSIGEYDCCAFETLGIGQFRAGEAADPFIGKKSEIEKVEELKIEVICKDEFLGAALLALLSSHPYEEPAIDILEVLDYKDFLSPR